MDATPGSASAIRSSAGGKASWSNFGSCVDWFAPGVSITFGLVQQHHCHEDDQRHLHGDAAHGRVAALYLQSNPGASPATVRTALYNATTKSIVTSSNTANNHLLFTNW